MAAFRASGALAGGSTSAAPTQLPLGGLTDYGWWQMVQIALGIVAPPALELSAYVVGADPDSDFITEVSYPGYSHASVTFTVNTDGSITNAYDVVLGPVVGVTPFEGAAIGDGTDVWMFDDNSVGTVPDGECVTWPAGSIHMTVGAA